MRRLFSLDNQLSRLGGWYIMLVILISQLSAIPGGILGVAAISLNAEYTREIQDRVTAPTPLFILAGNVILLIVTWYLTPVARKRLDAWVANRVRSDTREELAAWQEITALSWKYAIAAILISYAVDVMPTSIYFHRIGVTTFDQMVYALMGGLVAVLATALFSVLIIERLLTPARLVLVPKDFDLQLEGLSGARLTAKFQTLILILTAIAILMIAPVGYHFMSNSLTPETEAVRQVFQNEAILISALTLVLGAVLGYFISRTVSIPLGDLIATLKAVEAGDLSQRAQVTSTDEIAEVTMHLNRMVASLEELQTTLEKQVEERTRLLSATNEVAKVSSSILDPDDLLAKVINLFTDQFNYYYAAIYLIDPGEKWAELKEATGEAGKVLKQNHHRLELSGKSMVATAIRERAPRISQNTSDEKQRVENPLLPYTRSEVALPLIVGDRVIGALNVQSTRAADFGVQTIETMQNMTGQVTIALENARLFQETQARIREMRAIQQQYLLEGWGSLSAKEEDLEYSVGDINEANSQHFASAINLRDQIIGEITLEGTGIWSPEQKNLVDAVASQAAIALENARLVNESRQIAVRERMLAEINSKIWSSTTIDAVLQTAIKELGRRLDASSATIELKLDDKS